MTNREEDQSNNKRKTIRYSDAETIEEVVGHIENTSAIDDHIYMKVQLMSTQEYEKQEQVEHEKVKQEEVSQEEVKQDKANPRATAKPRAKANAEDEEDRVTKMSRAELEEINDTPNQLYNAVNIIEQMPSLKH